MEGGRRGPPCTRGHAPDAPRPAPARGGCGERRGWRRGDARGRVPGRDSALHARILPSQTRPPGPAAAPPAARGWVSCLHQPGTGGAGGRARGARGASRMVRMKIEARERR